MPLRWLPTGDESEGLHRGQGEGEGEDAGPGTRTLLDPASTFCERDARRVLERLKRAATCA